jgi:hypothetical protein
MVLACGEAAERSPWRFVYTERDVWKAFMDEYPGMTWLATVVYQQSLLGEIHTTWLDDGQFAYVPAWNASDCGCAIAGWNRRELGSPEAAALVLLCCETERDPVPAVAEEHRLRHLTTAALRLELAARDGWTCHLCAAPIARDPVRHDAGPDSLFADVEHVQPLKSGGPHWWPNLRLVHHACKLAKGDGDYPYEPETRVMLRSWLNNHPDARPCPVDSVDPAHYNGDGTCKCRSAIEERRERRHAYAIHNRELRSPSLTEIAAA